MHADVTVDASAETIAALALYDAECIERGKIRDRAAQRWRDLYTLKPGDTVRVTKGRKVPIGSVHVVRWVGETRFGESVRIDSGFIARDNVAKIAPAALIAEIRGECFAAGLTAEYLDSQAWWRLPEPCAEGELDSDE